MANLFRCTGINKNLGVFVCGGSKGASYYSRNGVTWSLIKGIPDKKINAIGYGNERFLMSFSGGEIYHSMDGENWSLLSSSSNSNGINTAHGISCIAYGHGIFVACSSNTGYSYYSTDNGKTWTPMSGGLDSPYYHYGDVVYGNGRFVCIGCKNGNLNDSKSYYSTDGINWTPMSGLDTEGYFRLAYGNGRFVCIGNYKSYYSIDGVNWTPMNGLDTNLKYYGLAYGNGRFVCIGNTTNNQGGKSYYSIDGVNWTPMSGLPIYSINNDLAYGNGRFVCTAYAGKSYYSTDGVNWTPMSGLDTIYINSSGNENYQVYETVAYGEI